MITKDRKVTSSRVPRIPTGAYGLLALAAFGIATAAGKPDPLVREELHHATATVEAVDAAERTLVLQSSKGSRFVVEAGPQIRNFEQIKVGDRVAIGFYAGVAIAVKPRGKGAKDVEEAISTAGASHGQTPGGTIGHTIATTVKIESVDTSFNTVTFKRSDGIVRTVAVEDPEARDFIGKLKRGDEVEIAYTEAVAANIQPAGG